MLFDAALPPCVSPGVEKFTLQDVGLLVGDKDNEQLFQGLVNIADMIGLDSGVLLAAAGELWERGDQAFNSGPRHLSKLTRDERC